MKKTIYSLLIAASLVACSKSADNAWTAPDPSNPFAPTNGKDVSLSAEVYPAKSINVSGGSYYWFVKIHVSAQYGLNATGRLYYKYTNPYYTAPNTQLVNVALPVVNRDTVIETSQPAIQGMVATNFKIDSVKCSNAAYVFHY